jgi:hypothetical protein
MDWPEAGHLRSIQEGVTSLLAMRTGEKRTRFEDLLRESRNAVFHFESSYMSDDLRLLYKEAGHLPTRLHERLELFFVVWFQSQQRK